MDELGVGKPGMDSVGQSKVKKASHRSLIAKKMAKGVGMGIGRTRTRKAWLAGGWSPPTSQGPRPSLVDGQAIERAPRHGVVAVEGGGVRMLALLR